MSAEDEIENVIEISTLSDEEVVLNWAARGKISQDAIEKLFKEGFTSMEAMLLLEDEDLARTKIPRGQQKLILAAVRKLLKSTERAGNSAHVQTDARVGDDVTGDSLSRGTRSTRDLGSSQSAQGGSQQQQHGGSNTASNTDAFTSLLNDLQAGQSVLRNNLVQTNQTSEYSGQGLTVQGSTANMNNVLLNQMNGSSHSWKDPQIFLESAASGKSAPTYYDITDFVSNQVEEEAVVGGNGAQQVVLKSGPRKPKLENVTLAQWSVANLAILYKLVSESKLHAGNILDYLSYTTKVCQLVQRYTLISVLLYDREYRQLQARQEFRWGTDVPHLHTMHLQTRTSRPAQPAPRRANTGIQRNVTSTGQNVTLDGRVICKLFNSRVGCHYKECKFVHQCSHSGCHQFHSAQTHNLSKN